MLIFIGALLKKVIHLDSRAAFTFQAISSKLDLRHYPDIVCAF